MTNLFKKAAVCTDLHLGLKGNSLTHNIDCVNFIDWFCETAQLNNCETCFFLGDWHNHRATVNIQTLNFSLQCIEKLSKSFDHVYFIAGNHDLFFKDKRDVNSIEWAKHIPNVTIINDWFSKGDVVIAPWLVNDDYKKLSKMHGKYMFGHFELPHFYMNSLVAMPDHGDIQVNHLNGFEAVFSGHFHKRQTNKNITYIGNAFPHNYSDVGDDDRGMMMLEWGGTPQFKSWPHQPTFRVYKLSEILDDPDSLLIKDSHVRVSLDIPISYEEASYIKEALIPKHGLREMTLLPIKITDGTSSTSTDQLVFEPVEKIIIDQINAIDSEFFDAKILLNIYQNL